MQPRRHRQWTAKYSLFLGLESKPLGIFAMHAHLSSLIIYAVKVENLHEDYLFAC